MTGLHASQWQHATAERGYSSGMPRRCAAPEWRTAWPRDDDFVVEELPAYLPCGQGEHVYLRVFKRALTTMEVARQLASAFGVRVRNIGYAGLKDRAALTSQWFSVPLLTDESEGLQRLAGREELWVAEHSRHRNKLRTGHSRGNRFELRLPSCTEPQFADLSARLERIRREGMPNYFGRQRFGSDAGNVLRALHQLEQGSLGETRLSRLLVSALQSAVFNLALGLRAQTQGFDALFEGDVLTKVDSGACFVCTDASTDQERMSRREVVWTGPMLGPKMLEVAGISADIEREAALAVGLREQDGRWYPLTEAERWARGSRRASLVWPSELTLDREEDGRVRLRVALPSGSYVTVLLRELLFETDEFELDEAAQAEPEPEPV